MGLLDKIEGFLLKASEKLEDIKEELEQKEQQTQTAEPKETVRTEAAEKKVPVKEEAEEVEYYNGFKMPSKAVQNEAYSAWCLYHAERGIAEFQYYSACKYEDGLGLEQNEVKALEWYEKAAEQGYVDAWKQCGRCYANGIGKEADLEKARDYWEKSAATGDKEVMHDLALLYLTEEVHNVERALMWMEKSAELGLVQAQTMMAGFYKYGLGVEENQAKWFKWAQIAADNGSTECMMQLGKGYWNGVEGVIERNPIKAKDWFYKAAIAGDADAMFIYGGMYVRGDGVPVDHQEATIWFEKAAALGHEDAIAALNGRSTNA